MARTFLIALGIVWVLTGLYVLADPEGFYASIPGLSLMGPFSVHFIRDVGLAFVASGGALAWGARAGAFGIALAGLAWPFLHALFHVQIWAHRGFPLDGIFAFDVVVVIAPPVLGLLAARALRAGATFAGEGAAP